MGGGLGVVIRSREENSRWKMAFQVVVRLYGCDLIGGRVWEVEVDFQKRERFFSIIYNIGDYYNFTTCIMYLY